MKWNESGFRFGPGEPPEDGEMSEMTPPDTGIESQTPEVWGRALYLSVTEAPHNTEF